MFVQSGGDDCSSNEGGGDEGDLLTECSVVNCLIEQE